MLSKLVRKAAMGHLMHAICRMPEAACRHTYPVLLAPQVLLHVDEREDPDVADVTVVQGHALLVIAAGEVADQAALARLDAAVAADVLVTVLVGITDTPVVRTLQHKRRQCMCPPQGPHWLPFTPVTSHGATDCCACARHGRPLTSPWCAGHANTSCARAHGPNLYVLHDSTVAARRAAAYAAVVLPSRHS